MTGKTKIAELELPEETADSRRQKKTADGRRQTAAESETTGSESPEPLETQDDGTVENAEDSSEVDSENESTESDDTDVVETDPDIQPVELTPEEKIVAYVRKEQTLREAQSDLNSLEDQQADARRNMNSFKKPISEARAKVERLISCDMSGFLLWEKEQELPLLRKAEEEANAWRMRIVQDLDVTAKDREKLGE